MHPSLRACPPAPPQCHRYTGASRASFLRSSPLFCCSWFSNQHQQTLSLTIPPVRTPPAHTAESSLLLGRTAVILVITLSTAIVLLTTLSSAIALMIHHFFVVVRARLPPCSCATATTQQLHLPLVLINLDICSTIVRLQPHVQHLMFQGNVTLHHHILALPQNNLVLLSNLLHRQPHRQSPALSIAHLSHSERQLASLSAPSTWARLLPVCLWTSMCQFCPGMLPSPSQNRISPVPFTKHLLHLSHTVSFPKQFCYLSHIG